MRNRSKGREADRKKKTGNYGTKIKCPHSLSDHGIYICIYMHYPHYPHIYVSWKLKGTSLGKEEGEQWGKHEKQQWYL